MKNRIWEAVRLMADEAERRGENANDDGGNVWSIVSAHRLGFNAWLCVCCELANRSARREGFKSEADRAYSQAEEKVAAQRRNGRIGT